MSVDPTDEAWNLIATNSRSRVISPEIIRRTGTSNGSVNERTNPFAALDDSSVDTDRSQNISGLRLALTRPRLSPNRTRIIAGTDIETELLAATRDQQDTHHTATNDITNAYSVTSFPRDNSTDTTDSETDNDSIPSMSSISDTNPLGNLLADMKTLQANVAPVTKDMNYAQVVIFREAMGSTLAQYPNSKHDSGFSWLVDTTTTYQERLGDPKATRPTAPTRPREPTPDATTGKIDKMLWYTYGRELKHYKECAHWTNQILIAIEHKFPFSLEAKKNRFAGFPISFTSQEAIELVATTVNNDISRREAHCATQLTILTKEFHFTTDRSTIEFFKDMENLKHNIDILDCGGMSYDNLIVHCLAAMRNSHLPTDKTRTIETEWNRAENREPPDTRDTKATFDRWERFKAHYIRGIDELKEDGLLRTGKANRITEERLSDLETRFNQHDYELDAINNTQTEHDKAFQSMGSSIPGVIGTTLGSQSAMSATATTQQIIEIVNKAFEARMADITVPPAQPSPTPRRPGTPTAGTTTPHTEVWRQWNLWCHTHGTNLRHNSKDCGHPRDGHKVEATKLNPMGGNTKRDHLWGKWCSPVDHKPYDTPN